MGKYRRITVILNKMMIFIFSIILFSVSLALDSFSTDRDGVFPSLGLDVLLSGFFAFVLTFANFTWMANPILFFAWRSLYKGQKRRAVISTAIASILAISFSFADAVVVDESGSPAQITGLGAGYWLWLASIAMALLASLLMPNERSDEGDEGEDAQN